MSAKITARTRSLLNQINKNPSIVMDIEGSDLIFGSSVIFEDVTWDQEGVTWDQDGVFWDSLIPKSNARSYISMKDSTRAITQQIYPDKEGSSSIASAAMSIIDKNGEVSAELSSNNIGEILGKKATLSIGFVGGGYPIDYIDIMNGVITDYGYSAGVVKITLSHVDTLRRQAVLTNYNSTLTSSIDASTTTIPVSSTEKLLDNQDILSSYIKIDDEIMAIVSIDSPTQLTVQREVLQTTASTHDLSAEVVSVYQLSDFPLDIALKLMHSDKDNSFFDSDIEIKSFQEVNASQFINNAIIFEHFDIERATGLVAGDTIQIDVEGDFTALSFGKLGGNLSYIIVEEDLETKVIEESWRFRSKYNVLNFGLGMFPFEIDTQEFEYIKQTFAPNFVQNTFTFFDGIENARDFINKELLFVAGCYGIPRNARSSVKFIAPPLTVEDLPTINSQNILNLPSLKPTRSINKFFYNDILYKFNKSLQDDEFKSITQFINVDSLNTFSVGNKQLKIESDGLQRDSETDIAIQRLAKRFLNRYKNAATFIKGIELPLKSGFQLQVGDIVFFGGSDTKLVDYTDGSRNLPLDKYEILNQTVDLTGKVKIDLLSTGFSTVGNYGVFSPASIIGAGSTINSLVLSPINNAEKVDFEPQKYKDLIGAKIRVRKDDFSSSQIGVITSLSSTSPNKLNVSGLATTPDANDILELAPYDEHPIYNSGSDITDYVKLKYTFTMKSQKTTSIINDSTFEVADATGFFDGQLIDVHSVDFTDYAEGVTIDTVVGNTITLTEDLPFTPLNGYFVKARELSDFDGYFLL